MGVPLTYVYPWYLLCSLGHYIGLVSHRGTLVGVHPTIHCKSSWLKEHVRRWCFSGFWLIFLPKNMWKHKSIWRKRMFLKKLAGEFNPTKYRLCVFVEMGWRPFLLVGTKTRKISSVWHVWMIRTSELRRVSATKRTGERNKTEMQWVHYHKWMNGHCFMVTQTAGTEYVGMLLRKLTWLWKTHHLKMYFLLQIGIFQCRVSFQGCNFWGIWPLMVRFLFWGWCPISWPGRSFKFSCGKSIFKCIRSEPAINGVRVSCNSYKWRYELGNWGISPGIGTLNVRFRNYFWFDRWNISYIYVACFF